MLNLVNIIKVNKFQLLISLIRILISLTLVHHNINIHPQINQFNKIWDINLKHLLFSSHLKDYIIHHLVTQVRGILHLNQWDNMHLNRLIIPQGHNLQCHNTKCSPRDNFNLNLKQDCIIHHQHKDHNTECHNNKQELMHIILNNLNNLTIKLGRISLHLCKINNHLLCKINNHILCKINNNLKGILEFNLKINLVNLAILNSFLHQQLILNLKLNLKVQIFRLLIIQVKILKINNLQVNVVL